MSPAVAEAPTHTTLEEFKRLPLEQIVKSKTNPRTHFDDTYLDELARSIAEKGLIQPIVVRPLDVLRAIGHAPEKAARNLALYEIVAGECRFRSSQRAGLTSVLAIIRDYSDEQALELQLVENLHRTDLTPLEQAAGYRRLIDTNPTKHNAETIAQRVGMSVAWVWDRLKLNDLVPEAKAILEQERMTIGHAILLARLKPEDQERAIALDDDSSSQYRGVGLWRHDSGFDFNEDDPANKGKKPGKYDGLKPCSVRELDAWIRGHVRFDPAHAAQAQPLVFEQTAARVDEAAAQPGRGKKVISITHEYRVADDARDEKERTYGSQSWYRADGQLKSKTCEHSVLGVVVAGEGYGDTLEVCVARDRCKVHFADVIKQREKNQKLRDTGQAVKARKNEQSRREQEERKRKAEEAKQEAKRKRWREAAPSILEAIAEKLKTLKPAAVAAILLQGKEPRYVKGAAAALGTPKTGDDFLRTLAFIDCHRTADSTWWGPSDLPKLAKPIGVDVAAILKKHGDPSVPAVAKKTGKKR